MLYQAHFHDFTEFGADVIRLIFYYKNRLFINNSHE